MLAEPFSTLVAGKTKLPFEGWLLLIGVLLLVMAVFASTVKRLPITATIVYLLIGFALGLAGFGVVALDPIGDAPWLRRAAEIAVILSLFSVGLKLRLPLRDPRWRPALCLAFVSMAITIALLAAAGVWLLHLPVSAAILLGGALAPTDPVLASEVQIQHAHDRDALRLALSGEAGLNDGMAFPFALFGVALFHHPPGRAAWETLVVHGLWGVPAGFVFGGLAGHGLGRLVLHLRAVRNRRVVDEYLVLGSIAGIYGLAVLLDINGFLAVFAAGLALRGLERRQGSDRNVEELRAAGRLPPDPALAPATAPAYLAGTMLAMTERLERLLEVGLVLLVGVIATGAGFAPSTLWLAPLLFFVIRPISVLPVLLTRRRFSAFQFGAIAWFGIRGIGSIYYLSLALDEGLPAQFASLLTSLILGVIAASIVLHGISVTPALHAYQQRKSQRR